jgi:ribosomal protein S18 acetylase RimI-like enzyme
MSGAFWDDPDPELSYAAPMRGEPLLDELMADAWRPLVEEQHDGWRYRWSDGLTRRANSALAVGETGTVGDLVARAEDFYGKRGAPTLIHVSTASAPRGLPDYLRARGYRSTARTLVQAAATDAVVERSGSRFDIEIAATPSDEWFDTYWSVEATRGRTDTDMTLYRDVLLAPELPTVFAAARRGGKVLGVGQLVVDRGWAGVQCMATSPSGRRQGVASSVLNGLATEAAERGIGGMYLAVMATNDAGTALYASAGFRATHEYCYFADQEN